MRVAVIGTFHGRHENTLPLLKRILIDQTRGPDEFWVLCEDEQDENAALDAYLTLLETEMLDRWPDSLSIERVPTPRDDAGYKVVPYSNKINHALAKTTCDLIVYLDNGSYPHPDKLQVMADTLENNPEWGAVYCAQKRTGIADTTFAVNGPVPDGFCTLNYTQVMHRLTEDRWPLDMSLADPDLADGTFWRALHATLGDFHPVPDQRVLDEHHIPNQKAQGV